MSVFTDGEQRYLSERRLGRIATVGRDGTPHVVPVGWSFNSEHDAIDVGGRDFAKRVVSWGIESDELGERHSRSVAGNQA